MAHRLLTLIALLAATGAATAGYAQLAPPPGWTAGTGPGGMMTTGAANEALGGGWRGASTVVNAGGRTITMPASYRFAANASRVAARGLALNPGLLAVAGIAWLASECITYSSGEFKLTCGGNTPPQSDGYTYTTQQNPSGSFQTAMKACENAAEINNASGAYWWNTATNVQITGSQGICYVRLSNRNGDHTDNQGQGQYVLYRNTGTCPAGWYITPAGCVQDPPPQTLTPQEVEDKLAPKPLPDALPRELPFPLPIELPKINPRPGFPGESAPLVIPTGDPRVVPGSNPRRWVQPEVEVVGTPTQNDPWRVDLRPQDRPVNDPGTDPLNPPKRDPYTPDKPVDPNEPTDPTKDPAAKPEPTPGLCEQFPDILACAKPNLGEPAEVTPVPNTNKALTIEADSGWGNSSGSCPADSTKQVSFGTVAWSWGPMCTFAEGIRPVVVALAWFTAALTFFGMARRD